MSYFNYYDTSPSESVGQSRGRKAEYCQLFSQIRQLCKMERQEKVWKIYTISHAAPYYSDVIINFAMLNELLLKRSVAAGRMISISARKASKPDIFHDSGH